MNLPTLKKALPRPQFEALAKAVKTSPAYLDQMAWGNRKPSIKLARKLVKADKRLTMQELRPDVYGAGEAA